MRWIHWQSESTWTWRVSFAANHFIHSNRVTGTFWMHTNATPSGSVAIYSWTQYKRSAITFAITRTRTSSVVPRVHVASTCQASCAITFAVFTCQRATIYNATSANECCHRKKAFWYTNVGTSHTNVRSVIAWSTHRMPNVTLSLRTRPAKRWCATTAAKWAAIARHIAYTIWSNIRASIRNCSVTFVVCGRSIASSWASICANISMHRKRAKYAPKWRPTNMLCRRTCPRTRSESIGVATAARCTWNAKCWRYDIFWVRWYRRIYESDYRLLSLVGTRIHSYGHQGSVPLWLLRQNISIQFGHVCASKESPSRWISANAEKVLPGSGQRQCHHGHTHQIGGKRMNGHINIYHTWNYSPSSPCTEIDTKLFSTHTFLGIFYLNIIFPICSILFTKK